MDVSNLFNPGLYKITCVKNNKIYIGESSNVLSRLGRHVDNLENNRHDCSELQNDFNSYGKSFFKFENLEFDLKNDKNRRINKELKYINSIPITQRYNKKFFTETFGSKSVMIDGNYYSSLSQAACALNESRTNLTRKCNNNKVKNYSFCPSVKESKQKYSFKKATACGVNDVSYSSLSQAAKALNMHYKTVKNRIESMKYPQYRYLRINKK